MKLGRLGLGLGEEVLVEKSLHYVGFRESHRSVPAT